LISFAAIKQQNVTNTQLAGDALALVATDTARSVTLVVTHTSVERTIDRNLLIVRSESVPMSVRI